MKEITFKDGFGDDFEVSKIEDDNTVTFKISEYNYEEDYDKVNMFEMNKYQIKTLIEALSEEFNINTDKERMLNILETKLRNIENGLHSQKNNLKSSTEMNNIHYINTYTNKISKSLIEKELIKKLILELGLSKEGMSFCEFVEGIESKYNIPPVKSSSYYTDEDTITLYISNNELMLNAEEIEEFLKVNEPINSYDSEGVASFSFKGKDITIDFLLEVGDILDKRIIFCSNYFGSVETIKSLGLD